MEIHPDPELPTIDKAVILARGLGTRMRRADPGAPADAAQARMADAGLKAMIPIGRPFLDYVISALADAGFTRACLVIGPEHHVVRAHYTTGVALTRVSLEFAVQTEPRGTADAVLAAESFAGDDVFLVLNSDNYYPVEALASLHRLGAPGLLAFDRDDLVRTSNIEPERIRQYAILDVDEDGHLRRIVEKPDEAFVAKLVPPVIVSMNCWAFGPAIFTACRAIRPSARGELELPDAVNHAITQLGERLTAVPAVGPVLDLSRRGDIASVAHALRGVEVVL
jgi:glucose-1-phosphate thymidylyltransferase